MLVEEVAALFLFYIDEQDPTFFDSPQRSIILKHGYQMFRSMVNRQSDRFYEAQVDLAFANQDTYDLATGTVKILGTGVLTNARMVRPKQLIYIPAGSTEVYYQTPLLQARSWQELANEPTKSYILRGTTITLARNFTGTLRLFYEPESAVDWTKTATGDNEPIDDLHEFHDMIAMFAAQHYAAADGGWNSQLQSMLDERKDEFALRYGPDAMIWSYNP